MPTESINAHIEVDGVQIDTCKSALPITIAQGRSGTDNQAESPTCSFLWLGDNFPGKLGSSIRILASVDAGGASGWIEPTTYWIDATESWTTSYTQSLRFTGRIDTMVATQEGGVISGYEVTCVGFMPDLAKTQVPVEWPEETDLNRIERLAIAAGITIGIVGVESVMLTEELKAAEGTTINVLDAIHAVCAVTGGLFWEDREGKFWYASTDAREADPIAIMPCTIVEDGITRTTQVSDIINDVTIEYGPENQRETYWENNPSSVLEYGSWPIKLVTNLLDATGATKLATLILRRRSVQYWVNSDAIVLVYMAPATAYQQIQNINMGSGVLAQFSNVPDPAISYFPWSVEGWVEVLDAKHVIQYSLSDREKFATVGVRNFDEMRVEDFEYWKVKTFKQVLIKGAI